MDALTAKDIIGTSIIATVCALTVYALYATYLKPETAAKLGLNGTWQKYKLIQKTRVTHNTSKLRFALQSTDTVLGLPCGNHLRFRFFEKSAESDEMDEVRRTYTPISSDRDLGYMEFMIKTYEKGKMTQYLDKLVPGKDSMEIYGPMGHIHYKRPGFFTIKQGKEHNNYKVQKIGMVCGGTGITPMLQIVDEIVSNSRDKTQVSMIFGNVSIDDILLKKELEAIRQKHENIHIRFIIDKAPTDGREWNEDVGYVTEDTLKKWIFPAGLDAITFLCGPPIMVKIVKGNLLKMGHEKNRVVSS